MESATETDGKMKALVVVKPGELEIRDIPMPRPGPREALVKIDSCGICGTTDRELIAGTQPYHKEYPAVLGHESTGVVVEAGAECRKFKVGDRVTRPAAIIAGDRRDGLASCWGGFAEYGLVRETAPGATPDYQEERHLVVDPRLTPLQAVAAISLAETASWTWQLPPLGGRCVIVSGTGCAGMTIALWCKFAGARVVVLGRRDSRLEKARSLGADATVNVKTCGDAAEAVRAVAPQGADVFCDACGARDQIALAAKVCRDGGLWARYAVEPFGGYDEPPDGAPRLRRAVPEAREHLAYSWVQQMILRGAIDAGEFVDRRWPLDDCREAFAAVARGEVLKGMLDINPEAANA